MELISGLVPARGVWWRPANRQERLWIAIAFVWCLVLFAMNVLLAPKGGRERVALPNRMTVGSNEAIKYAVAGGLGLAILSRRSLSEDDLGGICVAGHA